MSAKQLLFFDDNEDLLYLLRDEFTTDRTAGSVNGTAAEPGPGTRTVVDTESKLSTVAGSLSFAGGKASPAYGDPGVRYAGVTRAAGVIFLCAYNQSATASPISIIGWSGSTLGATFHAGLMFNNGSLQKRTSVSLSLATYSSATSYLAAIILRAAGAMYLLRTESGNYLLLYVDTDSSSTPSYPAVVNYNAAFASDYCRIPTNPWLPAPLCSDGFGSAFGTSDGAGHAEGITGGIGSGGGGQAWTGSTWSVSGGKAINTPGVGGELIANGGFATDTNWTKGSGWTIAGGVGVATACSSTLSQTGIQTIGQWYRFEFEIVSVTAGSFNPTDGGSNVSSTKSSTGAGIWTFRAVGTSAQISARNTATGTVDNASVKLLTPADLFASVLASTPDVMVDVAVTLVSGTQAGLVLNLDSTSNPANFVIAYHDGTNAKLEKCVGGTYTTVISAAATYNAEAVLRVSKIGSAYRLYYNNALVGSGTISDVGIVSNARHGLFSTYSGNQLDNFVCYASGSENQYNLLNQY